MRWSRRALLGHAAAGLAAGLLPPVTALADDEVVLEEVVGKYNHVVVAERGSVRTMYFVVGDTYYIESRIDRAHPRSLDLDYTRTMMAGFLLQPKPQRILMIGFGGGSLSNYLFERIEGLEVDGVDIDGEVLRLARKYFGVPDDPRYRTHAADGRLFVDEAPAAQKWDMIILDAFRGVFVPFHLKTVEYYETLLAHLSPRGVVVANLHNHTEMYSHDRRTFAKVFPGGYAFHSESDRQTSYVATAFDDPVGAYELRANARKVDPIFDFDIMGLAARWYLGRDWDPAAEILRDDFPPGKTPQGAERHNERCVGAKCPYRTD
jgi:spermidine synthase